jgi:hypothetical protein
LNGTLRVVPEWEGHSLTKYLGWLNSEDPDERQKVKYFQQEMRRVISEGLGTSFPRVDFPPVSEDEAVALGLWGGPNEGVGSRRDLAAVVATVASEGEEEAKDTARLEAIELKMQRAVQFAVNGRNENLHVANFEPMKREVTYVIEQGVTYCIYNAWVVDTSPNVTVAPRWWTVSWPPASPEVTAYLNVTAIVRRID